MIVRNWARSGSAEEGVLVEAAPGDALAATGKGSGTAGDAPPETVGRAVGCSVGAVPDVLVGDTLAVCAAGVPLDFGPPSSGASLHAASKSINAKMDKLAE